MGKGDAELLDIKVENEKSTETIGDISPDDNFFNRCCYEMEIWSYQNLKWF